MTTAIYKGTPVIVIRKYHYNPNRWWIEAANGDKMLISGGYYTGGSVYWWELKDIVEDQPPAETAYELEKAMDQDAREWRETYESLHPGLW